MKFFNFALLVGVLSLAPLGQLFSQAVILPAPRLLTTMPMGGQQGSQLDVLISGEHIEDAEELYFSDSRISAKRKLDAHGQPVPNQYQVTIQSDCPAGVYETRVMTRLGISSSRIFSVGNLLETQRSVANTSLAAAMPLPTNVVCNASMTSKAIDHYTFEVEKGKRYYIVCESKGIDSKLDAVLLLADSQGQDRIAERRGGAIDFIAQESGRMVIKVHDLTFKGGPEYFYRLTIHQLPTDADPPATFATRLVSSFSWPPTGLPKQATIAELDTADDKPQVIELPCDIIGTFFPAADVDTYEFKASKGEVWWLEVASERLGHPTDPSVLVQRNVQVNGASQWIDVAEFNDIPSPVKVSSNGYAYDGPAYDAGSPDVLGKLEIKDDGIYRVQITDLFGGTRNDKRNKYRLIIRKAAPDFAIVAWPLHMELRNGDRSAFSKPMALRGGATVALEVVALRRDGFDGEIELAIEDLPDGVSAKGLRIAAGKVRGIMLVTADENAPRSLKQVRFVGRAKWDGQVIERPCAMAEFEWPVPDSWSEIPEPRLVDDVIVSVSGHEKTPFSLSPAENKVWEVAANQTLKIPLKHLRRSEFSGSTLQLRAFGHGFEHLPMFDVNLLEDQSVATLNLASMKTPPGEYLIAFYGGAVAKYRYCPEAVEITAVALRKAEKAVAEIDAEIKALEQQLSAATTDQQATLKAAIETQSMKRKIAVSQAEICKQQAQAAINRAQPRDIVDIVVSEPIAIRVTQ